jgi:hypothetical protein
MNLSSLLLAVWLILLGGSWVAWWSISLKFLGFWALITGVVWLVEGVHPITVWRR